jgi:hypothetical protein
VDTEVTQHLCTTAASRPQQSLRPTTGCGVGGVLGERMHSF